MAKKLLLALIFVSILLALYMLCMVLFNGRPLGIVKGIPMYTELIVTVLLFLHAAVRLMRHAEIAANITLREAMVLFGRLFVAINLATFAIHSALSSVLRLPEDFSEVGTDPRMPEVSGIFFLVFFLFLLVYYGLLHLANLICPPTLRPYKAQPSIPQPAP